MRPCCPTCAQGVDSEKEDREERVAQARYSHVSPDFWQLIQPHEDLLRAGLTSLENSNLGDGQPTETDAGDTKAGYR